MGALPHASIPPKMQEDEQTAQFMEAVRKVVARVQIYGEEIGWYVGTGSPEGVVTAAVGSLYSRLDGGPLTTLYVKVEDGEGSSGWLAK